jgi:hypothetical protein
MDIPIGWAIARTRNVNGTMGRHGKWDRWGLIRNTNVSEGQEGLGTGFCKACTSYFTDQTQAVEHVCPRETEYRQYIGVPVVTVDLPVAEEPEPEPEPEATTSFDYEAFSAWINDLVTDRNRLRDEMSVARTVIAAAEGQVLRLKAELSHQTTVAEKFRSVVLARESANDFGDWHTRKSATKA